MKKSIKIFKMMMIFGVLLICATPAFADDGPTLPDDPEGTVPIDGGLSLLVAAGVGYAVKRKKMQANKNEILD